MTEYDCILNIKKNALEQVLSDFEMMNVQDKKAKIAVESALKAVKQAMVVKNSIEESDAFAKFKAKVKEQLTLDNSYVKAFKPKRKFVNDYYDGEQFVCDEGYYNDVEVLDRAIEGLLDDKQMLQEFINECLNPEATELTKELIENIYMGK